MLCYLLPYHLPLQYWVKMRSSDNLYDFKFIKADRVKQLVSKAQGPSRASSVCIQDAEPHRIETL
jgi:hypothetical protein